MDISIFGLGYVGAVSLACLARDGHRVVGVDIDATKLDLIRRGDTPIIEEGMPELMKSVVASGRVEVSRDVDAAIAGTSVSFLCVGTPSQPNGSHDLSALQRLVAQLGAALRRKQGYHVFVLRSTVPPGTTEGLLRKGLEEHSGRKAGEEFGVCFQPEFLREGTSIRDYDHPPYTVVGGDSPRAVERVREVFGHLKCPFRECSIRTAEMLKFCCNVFHAVKITFANEVGRLCQALGVDSHEVMELFCQDSHLNVSRAYLRPGFAYGGSCLPKDLRAMVSLARRSDVEMPMIGAVGPSNDAHIQHAIGTVLATGRKRIGMIGLAFKSGTDDLRESPYVVLAERFIGKGLQLRIYDPDVNLSRLVGANRRYIEEILPHIGSLMCEDVGTMIAWADVLVVGLRSETILRALRERMRPDQILVDVTRIPDREGLVGAYRGLCW